MGLDRAFGMLALLLLATAAGAGPDKRAQLDALQQRIGALQEDLRQAQDEKAGLLQALELAERAAGEVARSLRSLDAKLRLGAADLEHRQAELTERQNGLREQRQSLSGHLRGAFVLGRQQRLKLLLNQEDPGRLSRLLAYHGYLSRARAAQIHTLQIRLDELRRLREAVQAQQAQLGRMRAERQTEYASLQQARAQRETLVAEIDGSMRRQGAELRTLQQDAAALQKLIERLESAQLKAEAETGKPISGLKGKLAWPVSGRLTAAFGSKRVDGGLDWDGVVIAADQGSEVTAVHHGRVAFADWLRGFGLLLILDHGDGYMSLYGFNQSLLKETGEWVEAGESIALVGDSGGRAHAGLYFGIRQRGRPQNPKHWCRRLKGRRTG